MGGEKCATLGTFITSNHGLSLAPGHWLILTRLDLPLHGKSLPFTARWMCSVGSGETGGRGARLLLCFKNSQTPSGRTPPWTQSPSSIWPGLQAAVGFGLGPPSEVVTMAVTDDKWGLVGLGGGHRVLPNKGGPLHSPFPIPSADWPEPMISLPMLATGSGCPKMTRSLHPEGVSS